MEPATHVPILLADIVGFTRPADTPRRRVVLDGLVSVLTGAARMLLPHGDPWALWKRHDTGDGCYIPFRGVEPEHVLRYALRVGEELERYALEQPDFPIRLRLVLTLGDVEERAGHTLSGAFVEAERFISDAAFKTYADARAAPSTLAVSDLFHHELRAALRADAEPGKLPWSPIHITAKHGHIFKGYVQGEGWAPPEPEPRPALPARRAGALLGSWLARVEADHRTLLPYFERDGAALLLDHVYVELELYPTALAQLSEARRADKGLEAAAMTLRDALALAPDQHPWVTRRWILRGDPGSGKTTLLRHLARSLATERDAPWVPVYESLPRWLRQPEWLLERVERELTRAGHPGGDIRAALEELGDEGRLLLLLDGLDEVPGPARDEAEALLRSLSSRWPRTPIVVTSRPIGYRRPATEFLELEVQPFDAGQRLAFLGRWLGTAGAPDAERAARVAARLEGDAALRELAENPLYLTLMALLVEEGEIPQAIRRTELYDRVFELLLKGRHRPSHEPIPRPKVVRDVLRQLAYALTETNRDTEPADDLAERLYAAPEVMRLLGREERWREPRRFLDDVAQRTGILGEHDGTDADWRFWHRTFREALTSEALELAYGSGGRVALVEHARGLVEGELSAWAEPYALLAGRVHEPDALVKALVAANRHLGLRAIATVQGLEDATVREVLKLAEERGGWEQRQAVYERIPVLVGDDPERALALIDQLRQRTAQGEDLFFLSEAVSGVKQRWPHAGRRATELLERFFDHIDAPPADLFRHVETQRDGRVALWCPIPAGQFWMGSPAGEEGRYDDEGPRHRVRIARPFGMAAVPVTNAQYAAFDRGFNLGRARVPGADHPVVGISWYAAMAFCRWLSTIVPGARLPTESEWEYACRAGTETQYSSGDADSDLERAGWYARNSKGRTHRVGEKPANAWGLYDAHGNVIEWTLSVWTAEYAARATGVIHDPSDPESPDLAAARAAPAAAGRVIRGGGLSDVARNVRSAFRDRGARRSYSSRTRVSASPSPAHRALETGCWIIECVIGGRSAGMMRPFRAGPSTRHRLPAMPRALAQPPLCHPPHRLPEWLELVRCLLECDAAGVPRMCHGAHDPRGGDHPERAAPHGASAGPARRAAGRQAQRPVVRRAAALAADGSATPRAPSQGLEPPAGGR